MLPSILIVRFSQSEKKIKGKCSREGELEVTKTTVGRVKPCNFAMFRLYTNPKKEIYIVKLLSSFM